MGSLRAIVPEARNVHPLLFLGPADEPRTRSGEENHRTVDVGPGLQFCWAVVHFEAVWLEPVKLPDQQLVGQLRGKKIRRFDRWDRKTPSSAADAHHYRR